MTPNPARSTQGAARWRWRLGAGLACLLLALAGAAGAATPEPLLSIGTAAEDDPRAALVLAQQRLATARHSGDTQAEFWLQLATGRVLGQLEDVTAANASVEAAAVILERRPGAPQEWRLWLELDRIGAAATTQEPAKLASRMATLRPLVAALKDDGLACEFTAMDVWLLRDADSYDEAWLAAEALERCGRQTGQPHTVAQALTALGGLSSVLQPEAGVAAAVGHLQRALQALGDTPARFQRSVIEWELGLTLRRAKRPTEALPHLQRALAASRDIGDSAGIAAANISIAETLLDLGAASDALPLLGEAQTLLEGTDDGFRLMGVHELRIRALAALKRPEVLTEIEHARAWDRPNAQPSSRAALARAMAGGYAALGHFAPAYAELRRAGELDRAGKSLARDGQVLRLQARYDLVRRDAENAELRHRGEAALLQLQAQGARQRSLWAALLTLAALLAMVTYFGARAVARRRTLADLALRDELTGQPNRRAVAAYAQAQFEQTRRLGDSLGVPLALAMIDLDHFKSVNDRWGHAVGDAALRAFASAASSVLRGQDRLGRWGGEEWLLVMPGTSTAELPLVFERLRSRYAATPVEGIEGEHGLTFSMGGAELRAGMPNLEALIAEADRELFRAKREGRNTLRHAA